MSEWDYRNARAVGTVHDARVMQGQYKQKVIEERRQRKMQVGEKKTPFTKLNLNKNHDDSDSIQDPDDDYQFEEEALGQRFVFTNFERPTIRALNDHEIISEVIGSIKLEEEQLKRKKESKRQSLGNSYNKNHMTGML